jgi:phosphatidyl-myo-inositol dimannoside synthase
VHFLGPVPDDELVDHYRMADVFVMPSAKEGFGIVFLAAMACGLPAIGGDLDGSVDPLSSSPLGRAVPLDQIAGAIAHMLQDPPRNDDRDGLTERFGCGVFSASLNSLTSPLASKT